MATLTESDLSVAALAKKAYLNFDQRQDLERSIESTAVMMKETTAGRVDGDIGSMEKQIARERTMLASGAPPELDTVSKNRLYRTVKGLEEKFTAALPTYEQMQVASPNHVDWHTAWERVHQQDVLAWKTGLMMLDPNNTEPNFRNIARLRGNKVQGTDPRKYWQGYEAVKFEEREQEVLDELIETMDDAAYILFLQLRAIKLDKPLIMKKLDWSKDMYAAAESRFQMTVDGLMGETIDSGSVEEMTQIMESIKPQQELPQENLVKKPPVQETEHESRWPMAEIRALNVSINRVCKIVGMSSTLFFKYRRIDRWPPHIKAKIETTLEQLWEEAKPARAEAASPFVAEPMDVAFRNV